MTRFRPRNSGKLLHLLFSTLLVSTSRTFQLMRYPASAITKSALRFDWLSRQVKTTLGST